jgi:nucleoside-diphosphate-sugar epimerase
MTKCLSARKRKNILITGVSGFIGKHLYRHLSRRHNVYGIARRENKSVPAGNMIIGDIRIKGAMRACFKKFTKKNSIDIVVHLASRLASSKDMEDMSVYYDNIRIAESLVEISRIVRPEKIINFSSIAVYPNKNGTYREESEIKTSGNTECLYGLSKFSCENILDFMLRNEDIDIVHLRVSQVYGDGMRDDRIFSIMHDELKKYNRISVFGDGERVSCFISIEKLLKKVDLFIKKDVNGIFNICDEHFSYYELAQRIVMKYGNKESRIIKVSGGSRSKFYLNTKKADKIENE